jgi:pilus assembly protein CpaB
VSIRTVFIVALALIFGISAMFGVQTLIRKPAPKPETVSVVVASVEVPRFATLSSNVLTTVDFPQELVPPGALTSVEDAIGRKVALPLIKNEPVLDGKLAARGTGPGMASGIPPGMRASTIQATVATGVAGFILPGSKVDVLLTVTRNEGPKDRIGGGRTSVLLEDVEIMAVDQRLDPPPENKIDVKDLRSITLLVTLDQAKRLTLAQSVGTLQLTLRNPEDKLSGNARAATLEDIGFPPEPAAPKAEEKAKTAPKPAKPKAYIRTLRGNYEGAVEIDSPE